VPGLDPGFASVLTRALAREPRDRPALAELIAGDGPGAELTFSPSDPTELQLLDALRKLPDDVPTRMVYADWLEGHGETTRASFLREESADADLVKLAPARDLAWRAAVSRPKVQRCLKLHFECPRRWDSLSPTGDPGVRHCSDCAKPVYFVTSIDEARDRGMRHECIAIDAAVARGEALGAYDSARMPFFDDNRVTMGMYLPPPQPPPLPPPPEKRGLLGRIKSLFGK
jgi:uncharacterized protein (TIGR02996 family)